MGNSYPENHGKQDGPSDLEPKADGPIASKVSLALAMHSEPGGSTRCLGLRKTAATLTSTCPDHPCRVSRTLGDLLLVFGHSNLTKPHPDPYDHDQTISTKQLNLKRKKKVKNLKNLGH